MGQTERCISYSCGDVRVKHICIRTQSQSLTVLCTLRVYPGTMTPLQTRAAPRLLLLGPSTYFGSLPPGNRHLIDAAKSLRKSSRLPQREARGYSVLSTDPTVALVLARYPVALASRRTHIENLN